LQIVADAVMHLRQENALFEEGSLHVPASLHELGVECPRLSVTFFEESGLCAITVPPHTESRPQNDSEDNCGNKALEGVWNPEIELL
jgi:hypothetical protein